jgi:dimeric dUTPase (all-alpha-NTP-PPase superfamily)
MSEKNIFAGAKTAKDDAGIDDDYIRSGGAVETDIYEGTIKAMFNRGSTKSKAMSIIVMLDVAGKEVMSQTWVTNSDGGVTYKDKKDGDKPKNLPGFNQMNTLALLVTGKSLGELSMEERTLKLWDATAKAEVNQVVDCYVDLHGEKVQVAIQKQIVDKEKLVEGSNPARYEPTGETREINEVVKYFPAEKLVTISEVAHYVKSIGESFDDLVEAGKLLKVISKTPAEAGSYAEKWLKQNKGNTWNRSKAGGSGGSKGEGQSFGGAKSDAGESSGSGKKKASSLFDDED